jgi:hypothetical protein
MAKKNGLDPYPKVVAELGPGDSLGTGLAALISGSDKYDAFDVVEFANAERNTKIFDELVTLFKNRTPIPGGDEFPKLKPHLEEYVFPDDILDENRLRYALEKSRIVRIRDSICDYHKKDSLIQYKVPWYDACSLEKESVDMVYSQSVLEYVDDLKSSYRAMNLWLKPTGYISHQIDFKYHGNSDEWNICWLYSDFIWKLIRGNRSVYNNREPHSSHIRAMLEEGFKIIYDDKIKSKSRFTLDELAPRFRSISPDDLTTSGTFIQAVKNA